MYKRQEDGGLHVYIEGATRLGKVTFNKIYRAPDNQPASAAPAAVQKFEGALVETYKELEVKSAAVREASKYQNSAQSVAVAVPFTSPSEWNAIRSRILTTPNVTGVDLSTLSGDGAVIQLMFTSTIDELQGNMQRAGLSLSQYGTTWVIQPM